MFEYKVVPFNTGIFTGNLDPERFEDELNKYGKDGWEFIRSIHETKKQFVVFTREAHFLVFKRKKN